MSRIHSRMKTAWDEYRPTIVLGLDFTLATIAGLFPLSLAENIFECSFTGGLWTVINLAAVITCDHAHLINPSKQNESTCHLSYSQLLLWNVNVLYILLSFLQKRVALLEFYTSVVRMELALFRIGVRLYRIWSPYWTILHVSAIWILFGVEIYCFRCNEDEGIGLLAFHCYLISLVIIGHGCFIWCISGLESLFDGLSKGLQTKSNFEVLVRLHKRISSTSDDLLQSFSMDLLLLFTTLFLIALIKAFKTLIHIEQLDSSAIIAGSWTVFVYSICIRTIKVCEQTKEKANHFDESLHRMIMRHNSKDILSSNPLYFHIADKAPFSLTVFEFVELNWKLIASMVTSSTTYLVICMQLKHKNES